MPRWSRASVSRPARVPYCQSELAVQPVEEVVRVILVQMHDDLGVGEVRTGELQSVMQLLLIEYLPIHNGPDRAALVPIWLPPRSPVVRTITEGDAFVRVRSAIVRTAMGHGVGHLPYHRKVVLAVGPADPAQLNRPRAAPLEAFVGRGHPLTVYCSRPVPVL